MLIEITIFVRSSRGDWNQTRGVVNSDEVESAYQDWDSPRGVGSFGGDPVTKVRTRSGDEFWILGKPEQLIPDEGK